MAAYGVGRTSGASRRSTSRTWKKRSHSYRRSAMSRSHRRTRRSEGPNGEPQTQVTAKRERRRPGTACRRDPDAAMNHQTDHDTNLRRNVGPIAVHLRSKVMIAETTPAFPCCCSVRDSVTGQLSKTHRACTVGFRKKGKDPGISPPGSSLGVQQAALFSLPPHSNPFERGTRSLMQCNTQRNARQPGLRPLRAPPRRRLPRQVPRSLPRNPPPSSAPPSPPRPRPISPRPELAAPSSKGGDRAFQL